MSDTTAVTPYQFMPPLSPVEYEELEQSIRAHRVQVPVIVDEDGVIIDGHHRAEIADRLGIPYSTEVKTGLSEDQKRAMAFEVNLTRRHLNREQKRHVVAESLKADPHLSDREHARRTGVSHPTVASVRAELERAGLVESFTTRTGVDGVAQPMPKGQLISDADMACFLELEASIERGDARTELWRGWRAVLEQARARSRHLDKDIQKAQRQFDKSSRRLKRVFAQSKVCRDDMAMGYESWDAFLRDFLAKEFIAHAVKTEMSKIEFVEIYRQATDSELFDAVLAEWPNP